MKKKLNKLLVCWKKKNSAINWFLSGCVVWRWYTSTWNVLRVFLTMSQLMWTTSWHFKKKHNWILVQKTIITSGSWPLNSELTSVSSVIRSDSKLYHIYCFYLFMIFFSFACVYVAPGCVGANASACVPIALYKRVRMCVNFCVSRAENKHLIVQKWIQIW